MPVLKSERLITGDYWGRDELFWNLDAPEQGESGGTPANHMDVERNSESIDWSGPGVAELDDNSPFGPPKSASFLRHRIVNTTTYPLNTVGRLSFQKFKGDRGGWCTGTLVGRDLLLTASHCFPWGYGSGRWMRFAPGFGYGNGTEPYGSSYVSSCRGVKNTFNVTGIDYIVCHLCDPLGDKTGWMGTQWWKDHKSYTARDWYSSGYPIEVSRGQTQMSISNLTLTNVDPHGDFGVELESDVFASPGWSGGPMWGYVDGEPRIVGVCSGGEKDCSERPGGCYMANDPEPYHDVSAGGRFMTELVDYALTHWAS